MFDALFRNKPGATAPDPQIEILREKLAEAEREIAKLRLILRAGGLDGIRGELLLPVKQRPGLF